MSRATDRKRKARADATAHERERDRRLYIEALQARGRGEKPTREQLAGWRRHDRREEHERRWRYYHSAPKGDYVALSGRQHKIIDEQAERYGLPLRGRTVDLQAVITGFHNFIATNGHQMVGGNGDLLPTEFNSPALERYREERARLAQLDRLEREGVLVERNKLQEILAPLAAMLRTAGENLDRQFGGEATQIVNDVLNDFERDVEAWMGEEEQCEARGASDDRTQ